MICQQMKIKYHHNRRLKKEEYIFWDRQQMNIKMSDLAVIGELNAFEEDLTLFRAIEREDVTKRDEKAVVNGYITVTP